MHRWSTIRRTINEACDEIIDAGQFTDTGTEVALCLLVNTTMSYLEHSASTLEEVARNDYDDVDLPTLLTWIRTGPPREDTDNGAPDDLMAVADAVGVNRTQALEPTEPPGPDTSSAADRLVTGDGATDVPTTLHLVPPLPPVIGLDGIPRYKAKHLPKCAVWIGLDCTCAQLAPKKGKGGGHDG